jgi:mRNA interferase MazF
VKIDQYGIYWVNLDPVMGAEISKTRPVVIVSDDLMNRHLKTVVGCPLTSSLHPGWQSRIQMTCAGKPDEIAVDQIRTLSKERLVSKIGRLAPEKCQLLRRKISEMYGAG